VSQSARGRNAQPVKRVRVMISQIFQFENVLRLDLRN
jgi:hypothetical protein